MILPEALYLRTQNQPFRYPTEFQQRRVSTVGGAVTTVTHTAWQGFKDRHLVINTLWVNWLCQPNAVTATRMAEINLQLFDQVSGQNFSFMGARSNPAGLVSEYGVTPLDLAAGGPQVSASWSNLLHEGVWIPAGYDLVVQVIARNAVPVSNDLVTAVTGFTVELGGIYR